MRDFFSILKKDNLYSEKFHNKSDSIYTINNSIFEFFSADQNDRLRGARRQNLFINECNNISYDAYTELEIRKIKVGVNPYKVEINTVGNIFVSAYGDYGNVPASISVINGSTNTTSTNLGSNFVYSNIRIFGDIAYLYNNYGGTGTAKVYNTATNTLIRAEFITDGTKVQTPYGLNVDEQNGDVYIADAGNFTTAGKVTCFNSMGVKKFSFSTAPGVNPNKILFKR